LHPRGTFAAPEKHVQNKLRVCAASADLFNRLGRGWDYFAPPEIVILEKPGHLTFSPPFALRFFS